MPRPSDHPMPEPLTPEESALAERLATTGPQREPSPALDARVLAAARAAVAQPGDGGATRDMRHRPRARRRWPAVVGVAATLVLAVGIAWQLRPVDEAPRAWSEAPSAVTPASPGPGGPQAADEAASPSDKVQTPPEPQPIAETRREASRDSSREPEEAQQRAAGAASDEGISSGKPSAFKTAPAPVEQPVFDEASPMETAPPPAPPAPPAPPVQNATPASTSAQAPQASTSSGGDRARQQRVSGEAAASRTPAPAMQAPKVETETQMHAGKQADAAAEADARALERTGLDRVDVTGARIDRFGDQPIDDQPPASADSPPVRQAWLRRIHQLIAQGRLDEARDSLHEYQRRYPQAPIPDDLRALLVE